jgi:hypothetical protein
MRAAIPPLGVRLPTDVKDRLRASAIENRRSMNAEIVVALEKYLERDRNEKADAAA